jgi:cytochrome d ubiquinol oxidase subunit II
VERLFAAGSLMAAMAQGWMLGAGSPGFDNGLWSLLFTAGIALTLPTAYAMLGAGWLIMKTWDDLQLKAVGWARAVILPMGVALVGISIGHAHDQPHGV